MANTAPQKEGALVGSKRLTAILAHAHIDRAHSAAREGAAENTPTSAAMPLLFWRRGRAAAGDEGRRESLAVVIPALNEEAGIASTLARFEKGNGKGMAIVASHLAVSLSMRAIRHAKRWINAT